ncbi:MAG: hypothetical protein KIT00_00955 [Rhodospirillales bacterium]|nr:hypothetical protein [Rhodospirillales bacterium]
MRMTLSTIVVGSLMIATVAQATDSHVAPVTEFAKNNVAKWISDPLVVDAVKAQNAANADLSQGDIDAKDKQWRAETSASSHPLIDKVLSNDLSKHLKSVKDATQGLVTEIIVMDNKGLNVGQSDPTSDYWQGDEAKWQKTFLQGADAIFVDEVEKDESTQAFQSQVSMSIADPANGQVIGSITVGVDVEALP